MPTAKFKPRKAWAICDEKGKILRVTFEQPESDGDYWKVEDAYYFIKEFEHIERVEIVREERRGR